jgi:hypothetical protein
MMRISFLFVPGKRGVIFGAGTTSYKTVFRLLTLGMMFAVVAHATDFTVRSIDGNIIAVHFSAPVDDQTASARITTKSSARELPAACSMC